MFALLLTSLMLVVSIASAQQTTAAKQPAGDVARQTAQQAATDTASNSVDVMPSTPENNQRDILIRLERTACFGNCPAYTVTILGDRSVTFVAHDGRSEQKPHEWSCCNLIRKKTLSLKDYNRLVEQIDSMGFFELKSNYSAEVTDLPSVTIMATRLGSSHSVMRYAVPCETEYRKRMAAKKTNPNSRSPYDYLEGVVPPPDSLCKLESMIDDLTGANKWGEDTKFHWHGK